MTSIGGASSVPSPGWRNFLRDVFDKAIALSNIPIRVPEHFLGDDALFAVEAALKRYAGLVAITGEHGPRGVGKTALAAAYRTGLMRLGGHDILALHLPGARSGFTRADLPASDRPRLFPRTCRIIRLGFEVSPGSPS